MDPEPGSFVLQWAITTLPWWPDLTLELLFFVALISLSFLASGAEVAYFSLSKPEIDAFKESDTTADKRVWKLMSDPDRLEGSRRLLATILITNNFVNVAAILIGSSILHQLAESFHLDETIQILLDLVFITSLLLFFGEITPKVYASRYRLRLVYLLAGPLRLLKALTYPLAWLLIRSTSFIDNRVNLSETSASLEDLRQAIDLTTTTDETQREEREILRGIVNFSNIPVRSIMRARVDVQAVDISIPLDELLEFINEMNYSRLPVYEDNLDNIKGVLHIKDLLPYLKKDSAELKLESLLREVQFIPETKKIDDLLEEFKDQRSHLAIVVDEFGGTAGIVTLEDVIEEIIGEINDEFDSEDWVYTKVDEHTYVFEGRIALQDVRKILDLEDHVFEDERGESESLGGLILEMNGKIPGEGEVYHYQNFELKVESVSNHRINMVKMTIHPENETNGASNE
ncbi:MAG: gliding motility-associated protein GldE [Bacteroidia bacterium]|nr:gliding motility-associated protein GldE [Bacteroidia bacterium]